MTCSAATLSAASTIAASIRDAFAGAAPMRERQHQRVEAVHTGVRVTDRIRFDRVLVRMAGQPA